MTILHRKFSLTGILVVSTVLVVSACSNTSKTISPEVYSVPIHENSGYVSSTSIQPSPSASTDTNAKEKADTTIDYVFTSEGQKPDQLIMKLIDQSQATLDVAIYNLSRESIIQALVEAQKRGVQVHILTDKTKVEKKSQIKALQTLIDAGAVIKINTFEGKMHEKMLIADRKIATVGSFNYTDESSEDNDEVLVAIHDLNLAEQWSTIFNNMWNDDKRYQIWTADH